MEHTSFFPSDGNPELFLSCLTTRNSRYSLNCSRKIQSQSGCQMKEVSSTRAGHIKESGIHAGLSELKKLFNKDTIREPISVTD